MTSIMNCKDQSVPTHAEKQPTGAIPLTPQEEEEHAEKKQVSAIFDSICSVIAVKQPFSSKPITEQAIFPYDVVLGSRI